MDPIRLMDVLLISIAAFAGFEIALAVNYLLLKLLLRFMHSGIQQKVSHQ